MTRQTFRSQTLDDLKIYISDQFSSQIQHEFGSTANAAEVLCLPVYQLRVLASRNTASRLSVQSATDLLFAAGVDLKLEATFSKPDYTLYPEEPVWRSEFPDVSEMYESVRISGAESLSFAAAEDGLDQAAIARTSGVSERGVRAALRTEVSGSQDVASLARTLCLAERLGLQVDLKPETATVVRTPPEVSLRASEASDGVSRASLGR